MTNEERDIIARFIARVGGASGSGFGSVPGSQPALPPVDREADGFISDQFARYPEARYRITQMAFVQEAALNEAQNRIARLQWELQQARQQPQQQSGRGGLFGGLFGGGGSQQSAPPPQYPPQGGYGPQYGGPPPQYAPGMAQPGMFGRGGSGFLGSALTTAAGVAGGMVAGNALMDLFSGHHGGLGGVTRPEAGLGAADAGQAPQDPWGGAGSVEQDQGNGFWSKDDVYTQGGAGGGWSDPGSADPGNDPGPGFGGDSGWSDPGDGGGNDPW